MGAEIYEMDLDGDRLESVGDVDIVLDMLGGRSYRSAALVRSGGVLVSVAELPRAQPDNGRAIFFVVEPDRSGLVELERRLSDGRLRPLVGATYTLEDAVAAFDPTVEVTASRSSESSTSAMTGKNPIPGRPGWGSVVGRVSGGTADAPLEQQFAFGLAQSAPDAVRLTDGERVGAALGDHRAAPAHLLGAHLTLRAGPATFPVGMEEHRGLDTSAKALHLPIPDIGVGSG